MPEIIWEKSLQSALKSAEKSRKPIFQDFWFDG
jgi:hypothetical protein